MDHYHVYVIELSQDVLYEGRFRKANPGYVTVLHTWHDGVDPDVRFTSTRPASSPTASLGIHLRLLPNCTNLWPAVV
jgi:hypothetical protein